MFVWRVPSPPPPLVMLCYNPTYTLVNTPTAPTATSLTTLFRALLFCHLLTHPFDSIGQYVEEQNPEMKWVCSYRDLQMGIFTCTAQVRE